MQENLHINYGRTLRHNMVVDIVCKSSKRTLRCSRNDKFVDTRRRKSKDRQWPRKKKKDKETSNGILILHKILKIM